MRLHLTNYNEFGSAFWHGKLSFFRRAHDRLCAFSWALGWNRATSSFIQFAGIDGIKVTLSLWPLLMVSFCFSPHWIATSSNPKELAVYYAHGLLSIRVWALVHGATRRAWDLNLPRLLFGRFTIEKTLIETRTIQVPMPESVYRAAASRYQVTKKRLFFRQRWQEVELIFVDPLPIPDECPEGWECEDTYYNTSYHLAYSIPEAIGIMVGKALEQRERYGGSAWEPTRIR